MSVAARKPKSQRHFKTPRCVVRGCLRAQFVDSRCRSHAKAAVDRQWAADVLKGYEAHTCELACWHPSFRCRGPLQAAHGFSRHYLKVRHNPLNGFAICQAAHYYWTVRPLEWDVILRQEWGETVYEEMRRLALS